MFTDLLARLAEIDPKLRARWRVREEKDSWVAEVQSGYPDGARPRWRGFGKTRDEALQQACDNAESYWRNVTGITGKY